MPNKNCLLEIGTEELPFSAQKLVLNEAENLFASILTNNKIAFEKIEISVTPCRIVFNILVFLNIKFLKKKKFWGPPKKIAFDETEIRQKLYLDLLKNLA